MINRRCKEVYIAILLYTSTTQLYQHRRWVRSCGIQSTTRGNAFPTCGMSFLFSSHQRRLILSTRLAPLTSTGAPFDAGDGGCVLQARPAAEREATERLIGWDQEGAGISQATSKQEERRRGGEDIDTILIREPWAHPKRTTFDDCISRPCSCSAPSGSATE